MLFFKAFLIVFVGLFGAGLIVSSVLYLAAFCFTHPEYVFGRFRRGASFDEEDMV
jgi:hypothetical protein